jgi:lysophospholipase L1-like esterase
MDRTRSLSQSERPLTWLFAGDSITQGAVHTRGSRDYTQLFRERLWGLTRCEDVVINTAVAGWGVASLVPRVEERIVRFRPDVLFLMFGTNDAAAGPDGTPRFAQDYAAVIGECRSHGIENIVLQTTVPWLAVDPEHALEVHYLGEGATRAANIQALRMLMAHIPAYFEATRVAATELGVALVDHYSAWRAVGPLIAGLLNGGFHPNEYGHRFMAHTIFRACGMWDDASWTCRLFVPIEAPGLLGTTRA